MFKDSRTMAVCGLRTSLLIVCVLELIITVQRQVFDFLGYMWLPIIANFVNCLLIIFGSFGVVQYVTNYLIAYSIWSFMWLTWNIFLICYYLNLGSLNRESGLLSLGTDSISWWETNGWGCQPVWGEETPGTWRPTRVEGCFFQWYHVELGQSVLASILAATALPLAIILAYKSFKKRKPVSDKGTIQRRTVYTMEMSPTETTVSEGSLKPMTPRRVKRRSGSRGTGSSVRRSRRSYRNAGYLASNASLPRESRSSRPTSAHSSYSNFHGARPASYHAPEREAMARSQEVYDPPQQMPISESVPINTNRFDTVRRVSKSSGYDVVGPYNEPSRGYDPPPRKYDASIASYDNIPSRNYESASNYDTRMDTIPPCESPYGSAYGAVAGYPAPDNAWDVPPPAPPYSSRATPQAPGPPAYQAVHVPYSSDA